MNRSTFLLSIISLLFILSYIFRKKFNEFFRGLVVKSIEKGHIKRGRLFNLFIQNINIKEQINVSLARYYISNNMLEKAENMLNTSISSMYKAVIMEEMAKYYIELGKFDKVEELLDTNLKPQFLNNLYKIVIPYLIDQGKLENYRERLGEDYFIEELAHRLIDFYLKEDRVEEAYAVYDFYPKCYQKGKNLLKLVKTYKKLEKTEKAKKVINDLTIEGKEYLYLNKFKVASLALIGDFESAIKESLKNSTMLALEELGIILDYIYTHNIKGWDARLYSEANRLMADLSDRYQQEHVWVDYANLAIAGGRIDKVKEYTYLTFDSILDKKHSYKIFDTAKLFFYLGDFKKQVFLVDTIARNRINKASENEIKGVNIVFWGNLLEDFIRFIAQLEIVVEDQYSLSYESFKELVDLFYSELQDDYKKKVLERLAFEAKGKDDLLAFILEYIKLIKIKIREN